MLLRTPRMGSRSDVCDFWCTAPHHTLVISNWANQVEGFSETQLCKQWEQADIYLRHRTFKWAEICMQRCLLSWRNTSFMRDLLNPWWNHAWRCQIPSARNLYTYGRFISLRMILLQRLSMYNTLNLSMHELGDEWLYWLLKDMEICA